MLRGKELKLDGKKKVEKLVKENKVSTFVYGESESDENNEEWKTRAALRDGLYKLIHL